MKATVKKDFHDKAQGHALRKAGSEWEGSKTRFDEINAHKKGPFLEAKTKERKLDTEKK
jgi:hypothetical protein